MFEIKKELLETHEALLNVEIEENTVKQAMQKAARAIAGKVNIPGFRKGKAPYAKVLQYVGEGSILQEAADSLIEEIYPEIIEQAGIEPYGPGALENINPSPLTFTIRVPLEPEVTLGDYHSLRQPWEDAAVNDEEVTNVLEQVRAEHAILEPLDRPAQLGDEAHINVVGTVDGNVIVDEDDIEVPLKEETPFIAPEFVEALVGMSVDEEKSFTIVFPEDFREATLRGAEAQFDVKIVGVYERVLPDFDDALASTVGAFETLDDLKNDIHTRLLEAKERQAKDTYHDSLVVALVEQSEVRYPPAMLEKTLDDMIENAEKGTQRERHMSLKDALQLQGMTVENFREQLVPRAEADVKRSLVLSKFATAQNIQVSDDEVAQEYSNMMAMFGQPNIPNAQRLDLNSQLGRNVRLTVLGRKTLESLEKIGRGEVDTTSATPEEIAVEPEVTLTVEEPSTPGENVVETEANLTVEEPSAPEEDATQA